MTFIRSKLFDLLYGLWTIALGLMIPVLMLIGSPALVRKFSRLWSGGFVFGLKYLVGLTYREIGLENKYADGPVIYACNHQSSWETLVFNALVPDIAFVLKQKLYDFPIMGWFLKHSPMIAVDREAGSAAMRQLLAGAKVALDEERSILIFPEGTRQSLDAREPYNRGVALLYKKLELSVVPVAINSGLFWSQKSFDKKPGVITISYLPAISPGLPVNEFMERLEAVIVNEKERLSEQG